MSLKSKFKTKKFRRGVKTFVPRPIESPEVIKARWDKKKEHVQQLANNVHKLRLNVTKDLKSEDEKESLTALVVAVMLETGERVGNDESASNGHFGITGLRKRHVNVIGNKVHLNYVGKSGVEHEKSFSDERIAKCLKKAIKNSNSRYIFETGGRFRIKSDKVNRYLNDLGITAKDLRGYCANQWIVKELNQKEIPKEEKERKKLFNQVVKKVAHKIGHGGGTLKKHYMMPELPHEYVTNGKIVDVKKLDCYEDGGEIFTSPTNKSHQLGGEVIPRKEAIKDIKDYYEEKKSPTASNINKWSNLDLEQEHRKLYGTEIAVYTLGGFVGSINNENVTSLIDNNGLKRFKIDDLSSKIDKQFFNEIIESVEKFQRAFTIKLSKILYIWDGYKYYPDLRNIEVNFFYNKDEKYLACYVKEKDTININVFKLLKDYGKYLYYGRISSNKRPTSSSSSGIFDDTRKGKGIIQSTQQSKSNYLFQLGRRKLFHEIQHAIQRREGIDLPPTQVSDVLQYSKIKYDKSDLRDSDFEKWLISKYKKPFSTILYSEYKNIPSEKECFDVEEEFKKFERTNFNYKKGGEVGEYSEDLISFLREKSNVPAIGEETGKKVENGISKFISNHGSYRYVKYINGKPVSVLQVMSKDGVNGKIANVYTLPEFRRKGFSKELLQNAKQDFIALGHSEFLSKSGEGFKYFAERNKKGGKLGSKLYAEIKEKSKDTNSDNLILYHGSTLKKLPLIEEKGLISPIGYYSAGWYMLSSDWASALYHGTALNNGDNVPVIELSIPKGNSHWEGYPYLWKGEKRNDESTWYAIMNPIPTEFIKKIHIVPYEKWIEQKHKSFKKGGRLGRKLYGGVVEGFNDQSLNIAQQMWINGFSPKDIWEKTLWYYNENDRHWKNEIPDDKYEWKLSMDDIYELYDKKRHINLDKLINHELLFSYLPEFRKYFVKFEQYKEDGNYGEFEIGFKTITLFLNFKYYKTHGTEEPIKTSDGRTSTKERILLTEIQHMVQARFRFAKDIGFKEANQRVNKRSEVTRLEYRTALSKGDLLDARSKERILQHLEDNFEELVYEEYISQLGEIEARDVAERSNWSLEERLHTFPLSSSDIPTEDIKVSFQKGGKLGRKNFLVGGATAFSETIDDTHYKFIKEIADIKLGASYFLEEIIQHNKLFEKYPEIKKIIVIFTDITDEKENANSYAIFDDQTQLITTIKIGLHFSYYKKYNYEKFSLHRNYYPEFSKEGAMLHEIQHVLQFNYRGAVGFSYDTAIDAACKRYACKDIEDAQSKGIEIVVRETADLLYVSQPIEQEARWTVDVWLKRNNLNYGNRKFLFFDDPDTFKSLKESFYSSNYKKGGKLGNKNKLSNSLIYTENFKSWFGDWEKDKKNSSKVVDKNGIPLIVYHGTGSVITEFKHEFTGKGADQHGSGFYFTTSKDEAEGYTTATRHGLPKLGGTETPNVLSVYLNIRNPLDINSSNKSTRFQIRKMMEGSPILEDALWNFGDWQSDGKEKVLNEAVMLYVDTYDTLLQLINTIGNDFYPGYEKELLENANKVYGYDGVKHVFENGVTHFVAWFPNQIKLATGENTTFYKNNNDIRFEKGGNLLSKKDFANLDKSRIFIPTKITKDELQLIISGKSKVSNGDTIQATLIYIRGEEGAGEIDKRTKREREEERLIEFIDNNNLWYKGELNDNKYIDRGGEHIVYDDPNNEEFVLKTNNLRNYESWSDYLINLLLNNTFFPDTSYELIGFKKDEQSNILPIVRQYYVPEAIIADLKDVQRYLFKRGFVKVHPLVNAYRNWELGIVLGDLHERNVLLKDDLLFFIDTKFFISHNVDYVYNEGGNVDNFTDSNKSSVFTLSKITKNEGNQILSGTGEVARGNPIQAASDFLRRNDGTSKTSSRTKLDKDQEEQIFENSGELVSISSLKMGEGTELKKGGRLGIKINPNTTNIQENKKLGLELLKKEALKYNTSEELLRSGGFSHDALDLAAFGFTEKSIKSLRPDELNIKWKDDLEQVLHEVKISKVPPKQWSEKVDLSKPIDVSFDGNNFYIEDGHHRYFAAKTLGKNLKVNLEIKANPIVALTDLGYDDFHRYFFNKVKNNLEEGDLPFSLIEITEPLKKENKIKESLIYIKEFKNFFGDWEKNPSESSKVLDKKGKPLIVYRGVDTEYTIFDRKKIGEDRHILSYLGFHFTPNEVMAKRLFSKKEEAQKYFLNIRNPLERMESDIVKEALLYGRSKGLIDKEKVNLEKLFKMPYFDSHSRSWSNEISIDAWKQNPLINYKKVADEYYMFLIESGYDGIFYLNEIEWAEEQRIDYIAFHPNQIKLADGSNTTFDKKNQDVRYEEGGKPKFKELKKVIINGFPYYYDTLSLKLYLDEEGKNEIKTEQLTKNEREQLYNEVHYDRPMWSFNQGGKLGNKKLIYGGELEYHPESEKLKEAKELIKTHTAIQVWQKTGWIFNDYDNKWRWELNDSLAEMVDFDILFENAIKSKKYNYFLKEILNYPDLYYLYPELKNSDISLSEDLKQEDIIESDSEVYKNPQGKIISFKIILKLKTTEYEKIRRSSQRKRRMVQELSRGIICHEIQHYLQSKHGFKRPISFKKIISGLRQFIEETKYRAVNLRVGIEKDKIEKEINYLENHFDDIVKLRYREQIGEREAWDVGDRVNFTESERKKTLPFPLNPNAGLNPPINISSPSFSSGGKLGNKNKLYEEKNKKENSNGASGNMGGFNSPFRPGNCEEKYDIFSLYKSPQSNERKKNVGRIGSYFERTELTPNRFSGEIKGKLGNKDKFYERGGLFVGPRHKDGGIPLIIQDTGEPVEVEGLEANIPNELLNDKKIYTFTGSNHEIINQILKMAGLDLSNKVTTIKGGDIIICIKSTWDDTKRTYTGTLTEILSAINESNGCKIIQPGADVIEHPK